MEHLTQDMHLPTHPAVKNEEKFFHYLETGDGDAGYAASPAGYGASPQGDGVSPYGYAYPGPVPG